MGIPGMKFNGKRISYPQPNFLTACGVYVFADGAARKIEFNISPETSQSSGKEAINPILYLCTMQKPIVQHNIFPDSSC